MTDSEFLALADAVLSSIEGAIERAASDNDIDIECSRSGNVLEIEFVEDESKIIVNSQAAMQEIWVAARTGGFHYRLDGAKGESAPAQAGRWIDTRNGSELFAALSEAISRQAGKPVRLAP